MTVAPEAHSKAINAVMTSATFCSIPIYTAVTLPHPCPRPLTTTPPPHRPVISLSCYDNCPVFCRRGNTPLFTLKPMTIPHGNGIGGEGWWSYEYVEPLPSNSSSPPPPPPPPRGHKMSEGARCIIREMIGNWGAGGGGGGRGGKANAFVVFSSN